jgi:diaminohydroxyphosphoribosylaminopyrimidine deaminase/5-amino-6-(5-phosphoribosylamino)uracil reductase
MRMALKLALKAEGKTSPNPLVGAVLVKDGKTVGRGYHKRCGLPHAEVNAIRDAGGKAKGATLYVTLEPCDHFGRTPPCTDAIIKGGIRRVVIAMKDPNPINNGRGIRALKRSGIKVSVGILKDEAAEINRPYIKFITRNMPYVTIKAAESLDGKIASRTGDSKWISAADSRRYVKKLRGKVDAVMIGSNTALKDDPLLLSKVPGSKEPARIIVDDALKTPLDSRVIRSRDASPVIIATVKNTTRKSLYKARGVEVLMTRSKKGMVDLNELLRTLAIRGMSHILVEGGGELIASFMEEGLADRLLFFVAPKIIGGRSAVSPVEGAGIARIKDAISLRKMKATAFKKDILIEAEVG